MDAYRRKVAVVGAGLMGHGIAQVFACSGYPVGLYDTDPERVSSARGRIRRNLAELVEWRALPEIDADVAFQNVQFSTDLQEAVSGADVVFEAIWEDLGAKRNLLRELEQICPGDTVLASNSSSLMPSLIAAEAAHPARVLVAHWFNPPYLVPLVEIVKGKETSEEATERVFNVLKFAGKTPVVVRKETNLFLANRLQIALIREALQIIEDGVATAEDIDVAVTASFGRRYVAAGPMETLDAAGWDLEVAVFDYGYPVLSTASQAQEAIRDKVARGETGMRAGKGFYEWTSASAESWRSRMARALVEVQQNTAFRPRGL